MIPVFQWPSEQAWDRVRPPSIAEDLFEQVAKIVQDVKNRGDEALLEYTFRFDGCSLKQHELRLTAEEIAAAYSRAEPAFLTALGLAGENIRRFHKLQKERDWFEQNEDGSIVGQVIRPLNRVGVYVPGGAASYPSSLLMATLPAVVAGVKEIAVVTPPGKDKKIPEATLAAAHLAGVSEIYRIGGAQAIAALAYGTETIRPVDKIVGPGNIYVTLAKKMVFGTVGIDMLAGPSEILIIGDGSANADFAACDLLSQAEHDARARAVLLSPDAAWAKKVAAAVDQRLAALPRREIAAEALYSYGAVILVSSLDEAFDIANRAGPEHLELLVSDPWANLHKIKNAGAVFLGPYSPEPLGDYWAGPNHILPTGGSARYMSPLTVADFCKKSSIISYTKQGLLHVSKAVQTLAGEEGLAAHGAAIAIRSEEV